MFTKKAKMKKCDLSDFDCGIVVGIRWTGLNISETFKSSDYH